MPDPVPPPWAFVSYSWTNEEHIDWVVRLAQRLAGDGVHVVLDQWDLKEGQDKYVFMEKMVTDPKIGKVLAICDKAYAAKADGRKGGVGTESQVISREVYEKVSQEKFIPIVRERGEDRGESLPVFFRGRIYIDFSDDAKFEESYDRLLRNIFSRPERIRPQLGQPPAHLFDSPESVVKTAGKLARLKDAVERGKPHVQAVLQEYLDVLAESFEDFRIKQSEGGPPLDELVVQSIGAFKPYRDNFIDFISYVAAYLDNQDSYDRIHAFLEAILSFRTRPEGMQSWSEEWFDNYRFIEYELFLYLIASLIRLRKYQVAARFIESEYQYSVADRGLVQEGSGAFNDYARSLDELRNNRLQLRKKSVTGHLIDERADHRKIKAQDIYQADMLLFLRGFFPQPGACSGWYPRTAPYLQRHAPMEVFARATSAAGLDAARQLLGVSTVKELYENIMRLRSDEHFKRLAMYEGVRLVHWDFLLSLESIQNAAKALPG